MADLPSLALSVPQVRVPTPGVSPGQVAEPYNELAANLAKGGDILSKDFAEPIAKQAGLKAVTRDPQTGDLQVERPPIIGDAAVAFQHAVEFSALAQGETEAKRQDLKLSKEFHNDPQGYLTAAEAFKKAHVDDYTKKVGPAVGLSIGRAIDNATSANYRSLLLEQERSIKQNFDRDTRAAITSKDEDIFSLIESGDLGSPQLQALINERIGITRSRVNSSILRASPGEANLELKQFDEKVGASKFVSEINGLLKIPGGGVNTANKVIDQMASDTSLSPNQRVLNVAYGQKAVKDYLQNQERAVILENKIRKQEDQASEDLIVRDTASENPQITENDIKTSNMSPEAKMRMLAWQKRDGMPEPMAQVSQRNAADLLRRLDLPDGDPNKITDIAAIRTKYINGELTRADEDWIEKRFIEGRDPQGNKITQLRTQLIKSSGLDQSSLMKSDDTGKQAQYRFERYVDQRIADFQAAKKNPSVLFDPASPDFIGKPEIVHYFRATMEEQTKMLMERFTGKRPPPPPGLLPAPAAQSGPPPRQPGETPASYLKRIGAEQ